ARSALTNPRLAGEAQRMELSVTHPVSRRVSHGSEKSTGDTYGVRTRLGHAASAAQAQSTDRQILGYTDGWTVTEEGSEDAEHERSVTVTYEGLVYPVAYDLT